MTCGYDSVDKCQRYSSRNLAAQVPAPDTLPLLPDHKQMHATGYFVSLQNTALGLIVMYDIGCKQTAVAPGVGPGWPAGNPTRPG